MKLKKKQEKEVYKVYDTWLHSYLNADVETYDFYFASDYHFIGSTNNEEFLNREDTTNFFRNTADQLVGKTELRNEKRVIEKFGELVIITHVFDAWFLNETEWSYYGRFRFTSTLQEKKEGWRFIYQHFSTTDAKAEAGETIGYDAVSAENLQLREAIKRRTKELEEKNRELEIESALERIRSQATAMTKSSDLLDIVVTMRDEFTNLGHHADYFWQMMWLPDKFEKAMTSGDGSKIGMIMELPRDFHSHYEGMDEWEANDEPIMILALEVDEALDYLHKMVTLGDFKLVDPNAPTEADIRHVGGITFVMARTSHGEIGYSLTGVVKNPPEEDLLILERFAGVFDLAHRRFLDLQKSESQAREVQIELGIEKVRSRAMAMQDSSELSQLVDTVFKELAILDFALQACIINIIDVDHLCNTVWMKSPDVGNIPDSYLLKFEDYPFHDAMMEGYLKRETKYIYVIEGVEKKEYDNYLFTDTEFRKISKEAQDSFKTLDKYVCSFTFSNFGGLQTIGQEPLSDENLDILARFGKVFDLTYTRFNDLKLAEAQARESRIELALERVRARTMAMQQSEELGDVATVLFKELNELVENLWTCGFVLCEKDSNEDEWWLSTEEGFIPPLFLPNVGDDTHHNIYEAWKNGATYHTEQLEGDALNKHYDWLMTIPAAKEAFDTMQASGIDKPSWQKLHCAYFSYGYLVMITQVPCPEEEIFKRFARVFDQTYTRFLDLQKAEEQARESEVELALERVRSRSMAMHGSNELKEVIQLIFDQMNQLNINAEHAGIVVDYEPKKDFHFWVADTQNIPAKITVPYLDLVWDKQFTEAKKKDKDFFTTQLDFEEKNSFYKELLPHIKGLTKKARDFYLTCPGLAASTVIQKDVGLYIENFSGIPFTKEENSILLRIGKVFQQTYTRFLDLKKAEAQAREAQIETALERVRSRTLAMHNSGELAETAAVLFQQLKELGIDHERTNIGIVDEANGKIYFWLTTQKGNLVDKTFPASIHESSTLKTIYKGYKEKRKSIIIEQKGAELKKWIYFITNKLGIPYTPPTRNEIRVQSVGYFSQGMLIATSTNLLNDESVRILERFTAVFEQTYTRFLDLQKAEAQARESQIEAALEKVRSRSNGMQSSEELREVIQIIHDQLIHLNFQIDAAGFTLDYHQNNDWNTWIANKSESLPSLMFIPYIDHPQFNYYRSAKEKGLDFLANTLSFEEKNSIFTYMFGFMGDYPQAEKDEVLRKPGLAISQAFLKNISLWIYNLDAIPYSDEDNNTLMRFAKVFEQTYVRFNDLKQAERQAKEAQIEAALEKVRSRTMAMQKGEEIKDVVVLLYKELIALGVSNFTTCGYVEINEKTSRQETWVTSPGGDSLGLFYLPLTGDIHFDERYEAWKKQEIVFRQTVAGKQRKKHLEYAITTFNSKEAEEMVLTQFPDPTVFYCFNFSHGYLHVVSGSKLKEEEESLLARFTKVFEQTYARFLDLKKAEAQAREAQIEAALERTRNQSMQMQHSDEIKDLSKIFHEQLLVLKIPSEFSYVWLPEEEKKEHMFWATWSETTKNVTSTQSKSVVYPLDKSEPYTAACYKAWASKEPIHITKVSTEETIGFFTEWKELLKGAKKLKARYFPEGIYIADAYMKYGCFGINIRRALQNDEADILHRFAIEFERAYTRFLDLQKAEAQTRESQIEAALERVRSKTMAMHDSQDVGATIGAMFDELVKLGIEKSVRCGIGILDHTKPMELWTASSNSVGEVLLSIGFLDMSIHPLLKGVKKAWKQKELNFKYELKGKNVLKYFSALNESTDYLFQTDLNSLPKKIIHNSFPFSEGVLFAFSPDHLAKEEEQILKRFTGVFEQTYTRFLDLQKAEKQSRESQIEAALERVRSKTMAMHNSADVEETVITFFDEVLKLGLDKNIRCGIGILEGHEGMQTWSANATDDGEVKMRKGMLNMSIHPMLRGLKKAWENNEIGYSYDYTEKDVLKYYQALNKEPEYPFNANLKKLPKKEFHNSFFFSSGIIFAFTENPMTKEASAVLYRFADVFGQTYRRYLDLRKAESQAREAEIELSLERVRNRAMTMQSSKELGDLIITIFQELQSLDMQLTRCLLWIFSKEDKSASAWMTNSEDPDHADNYQVLYHDHPAYKSYLKGWKAQIPEWEYHLKGKNKDEWDEILVEGFFKKLPRKVKNAMKAPERVILSGSFNKYGLIQTAGLEPLSDENKGILKRFSQVFEQNYNRFLDLKKAEAQAKEAQIEAALEKVRSRTMAMQSSDELQDAANLLFLEVQGLGINAWSAGYNIVNEDKTQSVCWMSSEGELQDPFPLYFTKEASFKAMGKFLKGEETFFIQELKGKSLVRHYDYMRSLPELKETFQHLVDAGLSLPTYQINHLCKFSKGFLLFITYEKVPDVHDVFQRFTKVFEQTYTRFQDLQKAENQSKEAQIELALERVRASTMAMHQSEQLALTAQVLFEQFNLLGVIPDRISIAIFNENKRIFELWATDQSGSNVNHVHDFSIDEPTCMAKTYQAWKEKKETFIVDLKGKELKDWVRFVKEDAKMELDESKFKGRRLQNCAFFSQGYLLLSSHLPITDEMMQLLLRFAKVFQQTYTRFLDLQKAETQAREAIKRTSVDRVRAEIASMRTGTDLNRITPLVWNELTTLDVPFIRCGVFIMDEEKQEVQTHLSTPDGKAIASFNLPFENTEPLTELLPHWRKKEMYKDYWDASAFIASMNILMNRGAISSNESYMTDHQPDNLHLHFLPFLQGMLYVGSEVPLSEDELNLVQNLAEAFSTAYSRYEDFNKLELANKKIEKTLVDLKQTQTQLVQSEKMASLGELTAGIAHEIQNPLNFVNNFSEVSTELVDEMNEEMEEGNLEFAKEIAVDLKQNLEKINHHGKRAGEIVKGMLQHSRTSSGQKELTDINALADEYLRLAYHGLRAKDKSFNAKMESQFDPDLPKLEVIPQDIGRVILNMITNAFYVVDQKKKSGIENYEPTVWVTTKKMKDSIEVSVKDNGNGIPQNVLDKIFQPFFTTKPTGKGTGLGLSLSYDIVQAHGGELKVETKENEGTEFKIVLSIN